MFRKKVIRKSRREAEDVPLSADVLEQARAMKPTPTQIMAARMIVERAERGVGPQPSDLARAVARMTWTKVSAYSGPPA